MSLILWILVFVVSLFVLVKSSDFFIESAEKIGLYFGIAGFILGVTIVAIGTSLPELVTSIVAVFSDNSSEIIFGNVVGSNITNILLILGLAAILGTPRKKISFGIVNVDLPLLIGSSLLFVLIIWDGVFSFFDGIICVLAFVIYLFYSLSMRKKSEEKKIEDTLGLSLKTKIKEFEFVKSFVILILSIAFLYLGAKYLVKSLIEISAILNIGVGILSVTLVSLGTSFPELFVIFSAMRKGGIDIAVGNVLGSNIFNVFIVMGIPSFFGNLTFNLSDILFPVVMMVVATFLFFFMTQDHELTRWEGYFLVLLYLFFIMKTFGFF